MRRLLLPAIGVPTLVLHREGDRIELVGAGRYVAQAIPGARYVELAGEDHWPWAGDYAALVREIERFVEDLQADQEFELNRILATVLFTDIVDSTAQAAAILPLMIWPRPAGVASKGSSDWRSRSPASD